jgi:Protein of unknown function (DUF2865)
MISSCYHRFAWLALALIGLPAVAVAQGLPQPAVPSGNPVCTRLEGQLAAIDRAGADPARTDQAHRIEEALGKQQADLDRVQSQFQRLGCQPPSLLSIFVSQPAQCSALNSQIQQMRGGIDRTQADLQRTRHGGEDDMQRQGVISALAQNSCGPQYQRAAAAAAPQQRGFFETLFGGPGQTIAPPAPGDYPQVGASGYRTLCVRTCDGYYFPISNSTSSTRFAEDEQACQKLCPASEVALYSHRNPGEDIAQAVSNSGRLYKDMTNAFRYRREFVATCGCRLPGQSWADALGQIKDSTVERGDIVVTEEKAKAMSQPAGSATRTATPAGQAPTPLTPPRADAKRTAPADPADMGAAPDSDPSKRNVRAVGPTFIAPR